MHDKSGVVWMPPLVYTSFSRYHHVHVLRMSTVRRWTILIGGCRGVGYPAGCFGVSIPRVPLESLVLENTLKGRGPSEYVPYPNHLLITNRRLCRTVVMIYLALYFQRRISHPWLFWPGFFRVRSFSPLQGGPGLVQG